MNKSREQLAFHEAGHAYMQIRCFKPIEYATIKENEYAYGHVMARVDNDRNYEVDEHTIGEMIDEVMIYLAGQVAEELYTGKQLPVQSEVDFETIATLTSSYIADQKEVDLFIAWTTERTRGYLQNDWSVVERIASLLLANETISNNEVISAFSPQKK